MQTLVPFSNASRAELYVVSGEAHPVGYASVVDTRSGDAVYLEVVPYFNDPTGLLPLVITLFYMPAISSPGVNGTTWRTELTAASPIGFPTELDAWLEPGGVLQRIPLAAGQTLRINDLLHEKFGVTSGLASIALSSVPGVFTGSRTWTEGTNGSYGVGIPPTASGSGATLGKAPDNIPHLESSSAFPNNPPLIETSRA